MSVSTFKLKSVPIVLLAGVLTACGGSGGSSDTNESSSSASSAASESSSSSSSSAVSLAMLPDAPTPTPADVIPQGENTFYVATNGSDSAPGTEDNPFHSLSHAIAQAAPGDVIVVRGGEYLQTETIQIRHKHGTAAAPYTLINYPGETPVFNFAGQAHGEHGLRLDSDYWNVIGLHVYNAGHNGIGVEGKHIRLERAVVKGSHDSGIHVGGEAAHNLIMNCDSYHNFNTNDPVGNRADGFAAKGDRLGEGIHFYGNRSWENSDDGFDFWEAEVTIVLQNNWSFGNGNAAVFDNPDMFRGGGNGFKLGKSTESGNHLVYRNLAFDNRFGNAAKGFDQNSNSAAMLLVNNTSYNNGRNYGFSGRGEHRLWNNVSLDPYSGNDLSRFFTYEANSWQLDQEISEDDFMSTDTGLAMVERQADGSLPDIALLRLDDASILVDAGAETGGDFQGEAPDLGAYELSAP